MRGRINRGLPVARLLMVISSLGPLFLLWAIRGAPAVPDHYWIAICVFLAIVPNLVLFWRWRVARRRNDHRTVVVAAARDQSEHLLVYLFAMLLPLSTMAQQSKRTRTSLGNSERVSYRHTCSPDRFASKEHFVMRNMAGGHLNSSWTGRAMMLMRSAQPCKGRLTR
jgi:cytochrome b561